MSRTPSRVQREKCSAGACPPLGSWASPPCVYQATTSACRTLVCRRRSLRRGRFQTGLGRGDLGRQAVSPAHARAATVTVAEPLASLVRTWAAPVKLAGLVIGTRMRLRGFRARRLTHPIRVLVIPPPRIRHSREGGNPRTNIPRTNANRDTTTCVHTASPTLGPPKTNATAGTIRESP